MVLFGQGNLCDRPNLRSAARKNNKTNQFIEEFSTAALFGTLRYIVNCTETVLKIAIGG